MTHSTLDTQRATLNAQLNTPHSALDTTRNTQNTTLHTPHATRHATHNRQHTRQHTTLNTEPTLNMQHATLNTQHSTPRVNTLCNKATQLTAACSSAAAIRPV